MAALESYRDTLAGIYGSTWAVAVAIDTTGASKVAAGTTLADLIAIAQRPLRAKEAA